MNEYRKKIDEIDNKLLELLQERILVAEEIGKYKKEHGLPVYDPEREAAKLEKIGSAADSEKREYVVKIFAEIIKQCRTYEEDNE